MSKNSNNTTLKDLNLLDSFLFNEATENPESAKYIAQVIIRRVLGWNITDIYVESEKQYRGITIGRKGIRLDLQVTEKEDGKIVRIYDIEPNQYKELDIPRRGRYYLSLTDTKHLGSSKEYKELPNYFSVWILPYDPFGDNRMLYTVKNMVVENPELVYNEGVTRLFLYTDGAIGGSEELRALLKYFKESNEGNAIDSELRHIQSIISEVKNSEEVGERYMTMEDIIEYEKKDSYVQGHLEGFISASRKLGRSDDEIVNLIIDEFSLSQEEAIKQVTQ